MDQAVPTLGVLTSERDDLQARTRSAARFAGQLGQLRIARIEEVRAPVVASRLRCVKRFDAIPARPTDAPPGQARSFLAESNRVFAPYSMKNPLSTFSSLDRIVRPSDLV